MTHTPGPWKEMRNRRGNYEIEDANEIMLANVLEVDDDWPTHANARVIAAAPDLLAACEAINRLSSPNNRTMDALMNDMERITDLVRSAIAKAKVMP